ncbi:hypothetical protein JCM5296_005449 [Sporobolomyces johnsonii]
MPAVLFNSQAEAYEAGYAAGEVEERSVAQTPPNLSLLRPMAMPDTATAMTAPTAMTRPLPCKQLWLPLLRWKRRSIVA